MTERLRRCPAVRSGSADSAWVMPSTPFSGVRISWLIRARNSLLAWLAASIAVWASCRRTDFLRLIHIDTPAFRTTAATVRVTITWSAPLKWGTASGATAGARNVDHVGMAAPGEWPW